MKKVSVLVLRAPGTNCDAETVFAFQQAGAVTSLLHVNALLRHEARITDYRILVIPGGFTYGDDIAAGKVLANELKLKLGDEITRFVADGGLILGICNGFQVLVKTGILPGLINGAVLPFTLTNNDSGKFECRWIHLAVNKKSNCVFTAGMDGMYVPVAHGEGKVVTELDKLPESCIVVRYADESGNIKSGYPHNPNGSMDNIAGVCDATGRIFALMPHPERHIVGTQHPQWTRRGAKPFGDGFPVFANAVNWVRES